MTEILIIYKFLEIFQDRGILNKSDLSIEQKNRVNSKKIYKKLAIAMIY